MIVVNLLINEKKLKRTHTNAKKFAGNIVKTIMKNEKQVDSER